MPQDRQDDGEGREIVWRAPHGGWIAALWLGALISFLLVVMWSAPQISTTKTGPLLELRPMGYELEEVRGFLYYLEDGKGHYFMPHLLPLSVLLALFLSASLSISSLWCLKKLPDFKGRLRTIFPALAVILPIMAGLLALWEIWQIITFLDHGLDVTQKMVADASRINNLKFGFYLVGFISLLVLLIKVFLCRLAKA